MATTNNNLLDLLREKNNIKPVADKGSANVHALPASLRVEAPTPEIEEPKVEKAGLLDRLNLTKKKDTEDIVKVDNNKNSSLGVIGRGLVNLPGSIAKGTTSALDDMADSVSSVARMAAQQNANAHLKKFGGYSQKDRQSIADAQKNLDKANANHLLGNKVQKWENKIDERQQKILEDNPDSKVANVTAKGLELGEGLGRMLPTIAVSAATGGAASALGAGAEAAKIGSNLGLSAMWGEVYSRSLKDSTAQGHDVEVSGKKAFMDASLEVLTEMMFGGIAGLGEGFLDSSAGKMASKIIDSQGVKAAVKSKGLAGAGVAAARAVKNVIQLGESNRMVGLLLDGLGEGFEEMVSEVISPYIERATTDPNADDATIGEVLEAGLGGMILSFAMAPLGNIQGNLQAKRLDKSVNNYFKNDLGAQIGLQRTLAYKGLEAQNLNIAKEKMGQSAERPDMAVWGPLDADLQAQLNIKSYEPGVTTQQEVAANWAKLSELERIQAVRNIGKKSGRKWEGMFQDFVSKDTALTEATTKADEFLAKRKELFGDKETLTRTENSKLKEATGYTDAAGKKLVKAAETEKGAAQSRVLSGIESDQGTTLYGREAVESYQNYREMDDAAKNGRIVVTSEDGTTKSYTKDQYSKEKFGGYYSQLTKEQKAQVSEEFNAYKAERARVQDEFAAKIQEDLAKVGSDLQIRLADSTEVGDVASFNGNTITFNRNEVYTEDAARFFLSHETTHAAIQALKANGGDAAVAAMYDDAARAMSAVGYDSSIWAERQSAKYIKNYTQQYIKRGYSEADAAALARANVLGGTATVHELKDGKPTDKKVTKIFKLGQMQEENLCNFIAECCASTDLMTELAKVNPDMVKMLQGQVRNSSIKNIALDTYQAARAQALSNIRKALAGETVNVEGGEELSKKYIKLEDIDLDNPVEVKDALARNLHALRPNGDIGVTIYDFGTGEVLGEFGFGSDNNGATLTVLSGDPNESFLDSYNSNGRAVADVHADPDGEAGYLNEEVFRTDVDLLKALSIARESSNKSWARYTVTMADTLRQSPGGLYDDPFFSNVILVVKNPYSAEFDNEVALAEELEYGRFEDPEIGSAEKYAPIIDGNRVIAAEVYGEDGRLVKRLTDDVELGLAVQEEMDKRNASAAVDTDTLDPYEEGTNEFFPGENLTEELSPVVNTEDNLISTISLAANKIKTDKSGKISTSNFENVLIKNGAKKAEIDFSGIMEEFAGKKSVTKEEIEEAIEKTKFVLYEQPLTSYDTKYSSYSPTEGENYTERLFYIPDNVLNSRFTEDEKRYYRKNHWDKEGLVLSVRHADITTDSGEKVLFLDEVQSDINNHEGEKRKNLKNLEKIREVKSHEHEVEYLSSEFDRVVDASANNLLSGATNDFVMQYYEDAALSSLYEKYVTLNEDYAPGLVFGRSNYDPFGLYEGWGDQGRAEILRAQRVLHDLPAPVKASYLSHYVDESFASGYGEPEVSLEAIDRTIQHEQERAPETRVPYNDSKTYGIYAIKRMLQVASASDYDYMTIPSGEYHTKRWYPNLAKKGEVFRGYRILYDQVLPNYLAKIAKDLGSEVVEIPIGTNTNTKYIYSNVRNNQFTSIEDLYAFGYSKVGNDYVNYRTDVNFRTNVDPYTNDFYDTANVSVIDTRTGEIVFHDYFTIKTDTETVPETFKAIKITDSLRNGVEELTRFMLGYDESDPDFDFSLAANPNYKPLARNANDTYNMHGKFGRTVGEVDDHTASVLQGAVDKYGAFDKSSAYKKKQFKDRLATKLSGTLPTQIDEHNAVDQTMQNIYEDTNTPDAFKARQQEMLVKGIGTHLILTDDAAVKYADRKLYRVGRDGKGELKGNLTLNDAYHEVNGLLNSRKGIDKLDMAYAEKVLVEMNNMLAEKLEYNNNHPDTPVDTEQILNQLEELTANICSAASRSGQILQTMSLIKKMTPQGRLHYIDNQVTNYVSELADRVGNSRIAGYKYKVDKLGQLENIRISDSLREEMLSCTSQEQLDAVEEKILAEIAAQIPPTLTDRVVAWRYLSMLGNPRTHVRNMVSNYAMGVSVKIKNKVGGVVEDIFLKDQKTGRTKTAKLLSSEDRRVAYDFLETDWETMKDVAMNGGHVGFQGQIEAMRNKLGFKKFQMNEDGTYNDTEGVLDKINKKNSELLEKEDDMAGLKAYKNAATTWLSANNTFDTMAEFLEYLRGDSKEAATKLALMRKYATEEAAKATYHDANEIATLLNKMEKSSPAAELIIGGIVPFKKTPANILKRGIEYSPIGLINGTIKVIQALNTEVADFEGKYNALDMADASDLSKAESRLDAQSKRNLAVAKACDTLASGLTGTGIALLGLLLGQLGLMKGGEKDNDREEYYDEMLGNQAYSITIGGKNYTLDWLTPSSMPLFMGVELSNLIEGDTSDLNFNNVADAMTKMFDPITNLSVLQGVNEAMSSYDSGLGKVALSSLESYAGQFIPTLSGQAARVIDPVRRTTYAPKDVNTIGGKEMQTFINRMKNKLPGLSKQNEAYVDMWGRTEERDDGILSSIFQQAIAPWYVKDVVKTTADDNLSVLFANTGDRTVLPSQPESSYTFDNETYYMSAEDYTTAKQMVGQLSSLGVTTLFEVPGFTDLTNEEQADMVAYVYSFARAAAKADYAEANGIDYTMESSTRRIRDAVDAGLPLGTAVYVYNMANDFTADKNEKGKSISGSKKKKVLQFYDMMGLTPEQKKAISIYED